MKVLLIYFLIYTVQITHWRMRWSFFTATHACNTCEGVGHHFFIHCSLHLQREIVVQICIGQQITLHMFEAWWVLTTVQACSTCFDVITIIPCSHYHVVEARSKVHILCRSVEVYTRQTSADSQEDLYAGTPVHICQISGQLYVYGREESSRPAHQQLEVVYMHDFYVYKH